MESVEVIEQLVNSMSDSVALLEKALKKENVVEINRLKVMIFDLYNKINMATDG